MNAGPQILTHSCYKKKQIQENIFTLIKWAIKRFKNNINFIEKKFIKQKQIHEILLANFNHFVSFEPPNFFKFFEKKNYVEKWMQKIKPHKFFYILYLYSLIFIIPKTNFGGNEMVINILIR